jgi:protein SCO1
MTRSIAQTLCSAAVLCAIGTVLIGPDRALSHPAKESASRWIGGNDYERSLRTYAVPDVVLVDADGRPVRLRDVLSANEPVMLNFIFTTCGTICPAMVRVFSDVPARLDASEKNLRMISISIDPDNDTPAQLKSYAKNFAAGARWQFLTGRLNDIKTVQLAFDGYRGDKMNHEPLTLIRPAPGKPWVRIDGFANPDELVREYRKVAVK